MNSPRESPAPPPLWRYPHVPMQELDSKDQHLISILQQNGRIHLHELASALRISKAGVLYRIDRLHERGILRGFTTHFRLLGPPFSYAIIRAHHVGGQPFSEWLDFLARCPETVFVSSMFGEFNTLIAIVYRSPADLHAFLNRLSREGASPNPPVWGLCDMDFIPLNYTRNAPSKSLLSRRENGSFSKSFARTEKKPLVFVPGDLFLMRLLQEDGRVTLTELARRLGRNKVGIKKRIQEWVESRVILEFSASVNPHAFFPLLGILWIEFSDSSQKGSLGKEIARGGCGNVLLHLEGKWSLAAFLHFRSAEEWSDLESRLRTRFKSVKNYQFDIVREQVKLDWLPPALDESYVNLSERRAGGE